MPPTNVYFQNGQKSEQYLYEDLIIEALKIYGHDVAYIPRKIVKRDLILNEDLISSFESAFKVEMYLESVEGFEGDGDLISRFGLEIRDQMTLVVSNRRWNELVGRYGYTENSVRPREGDLIWMGLTGGLFEIKFVEDKAPFMQLGGSPTFKLICELFEYESQEIDTGTDADIIQTTHSSTFKYAASLNGDYTFGETLNIVLPSGVTGSAEFIRYDIHSETSPTTYDVSIGPMTFDDGLFHTLTVGAVLTGVTSGNTSTVLDVYDLNEDDVTNFENDAFTQNSAFIATSNEFLDFQEINPFGEPFSF